MKKIFVALCMVAFLAACDDSSSASAGQNDEPAVESSSSSSGKVTDKVGEPAEPAEVTSSSSEKAKSSSSDAQSDAKQSCSSEKSGKSSCSTDDASSSSVKSESSSSAGALNCSALLEGETGWNWNVPKECRFNPDIDYGTMIDERDDKVYKTVKIGTQVWMAENLNYYDASDLSVKEKSWCFGKRDNGDSATCDVAGRLYTWAAAIDSVKLATDATNPLDCGYGTECSLKDTVQGVCPSGWHLPSKTEWNALFTEVEGKSTAGKLLKSQSGWNKNGNGTDVFGFSALPVGYRKGNGYYYVDGDNTLFWSSTEDGNFDAFCMLLSNTVHRADLAELNYNIKGYGFSVRCVKNN